jgi:hypothetical protein
VPIAATTDPRSTMAGVWKSQRSGWSTTLTGVPAARDLLSLRAARALAEAELLVLGDGVDAAIVALARRDAPQRPLADVDAAFLAREAAAGQQTVVLASAQTLTRLGEGLHALAAPYRRLDPARDA